MFTSSSGTKPHRISLTVSSILCSLFSLIDGQSVTLARDLLNALITRILTYSLSTTSVAMGMASIRWKPTSSEDLEKAETKLLSFMKKPYSGRFVDIGSGWGCESNQIWTIEMQPERRHTFSTDTPTSASAEKKLPLVMLHGFGCGSGIWCLNLDNLSDDRKVYAFDVLGFARSSRPHFSRSEKMAEFELVESMERWRKAMGLNEPFILLGHSFGGYLSLAYALQFPDRVAHVILADPWGIPSHQTASASSQAQVVLPAWVKLVARLLFKTLNPLTVVRIAGPFGPHLVHKLRPDIRKKFEPLTGEEDASVVLDYVYHCNAHSNPAGEIAFKTLSLPTGWAKNPMIQRLDKLDPKIDLSFIYGERSWIDRQPGLQVKQMCSERSVDVHVIHGAGHHVYADKLQDFNRIVRKSCCDADQRHRIRRSQEMETHLDGQD